MRKSYRSSVLANLFALMVIFGLSSATSFADGRRQEKRLTCRGQSAEYGRVAFTLVPDPHLMGKIVIRNCGLIGEMAEYFGRKARRFDTYLFEGFGMLNCQVTEEEFGQAKAQVHTCSIDNPMLAESMDDDIGVQFRQVMRWGALSYVELGLGKAEVSYTLSVPKHQSYAKKVALTDFVCSHEEIGANEGTCQP